MAPTMSKQTANYHMARDGTRDAQRECGDCSMFRRPNTCTLVKGHISSEGTCNHFAKKGG
jgi:hypothetical protein